MPGKLLRLLIVEDSETEAKFTVNLLKKNGYKVSRVRVETESEMRKELENADWDIIVSDYQLPEFDGRRALQVFLEYKLEIPFILLSGAIGEETAADLMKMGASDYVLKGNTARLIPAIENHLKGSGLNRQNKKLAKDLQTSKLHYLSFFENAAIGIFRCRSDNALVDVNQFLANALGYERRDECIESTGTLVPEVFEQEKHKAHTVSLFEMAKFGKRFKAVFHRKDGSVMQAVVNAWLVPTTQDDVSFIEGTIEDVTDLREMERRLRELEQLDESLINITSKL